MSTEKEARDSIRNRHLLTPSDDWIKTNVVQQLVHIFDGEKIFPYTSTGQSYSTFVLSSLDKAMKIASHTDVNAILKKVLHVEHYFLYVVSYHDHASGRPHGTVLTKRCNTLFPDIPENNVLSSNSHVKNSDKQSFAKRVDRSTESYRFTDNKTAFHKPCHAASTEAISTGQTSYLHIHSSYADWEVPSIPYFCRVNFIYVFSGLRCRQIKFIIYFIFDVILFIF